MKVIMIDFHYSPYSEKSIHNKIGNKGMKAGKAN